MGSTNEAYSKVNEWVQLIESGELNVEEYYEGLYEELVEFNEEKKAFRTIVKGKPTKKGILHNIPIHIKDNICTKGIETTAGSKILEGYIPPFDATVVEKIKNNGGVIVGKTNMDEFGFGTFSVNSGYEIPRNAFHDEHVAGGSSGGAAVATACMEYSIGIAVSTGGSISCPSSFNGVVGYTPTYGVVSRWGLISYANSLDKIGIIAKYTKDIEIVLPIIAGADGKDPTVVDIPLKEPEKAELNIGIIKNLVVKCEEKVQKTFWKFVEEMESNFGRIHFHEVEVPKIEVSLPAYYIISTAEASTNLARYCGMRYGKQIGDYTKDYNTFFTEHRSLFLGEEAKRRVILGTFVRLAGFREKYYMRALKVRKYFIERFKELFKRFDALVTPTMPILPPKFSEVVNLSPIDAYKIDLLTIPPNLCGFPHISLPIGYEPLPIGAQIMADHFNDKLLFRIGEMWETIFRYKAPDVRIGGTHERH